ncbi:MAG: alpha-E domain-containing protein, partial [Pseudomonadota bacterium]
QHLAAIPPLVDDGMPEQPLRLARQLRAKVETIDANKLGPGTLSELRKLLHDLSEAISARYFLQGAETRGREPTRLLA